jgi:hypothetical protein
MKKSAVIFQKLRDSVHSQEFQKKHRISENDFKRNSSLTFSILLFLIINQMKRSIADEIFKFCDYFEKNIFTKSAFIKARGKLSHNAFIELNDILVETLYEEKKLKKKFGMIVLAMDGFKCELPDSHKTTSYFGTMKNQSDVEITAARCSQIYDVLNGITIKGAIEPYKTSERDLAISLIDGFLEFKKKTNHEFMFIFDRGYPSILFLLYLLKNNINFIMRSNRKFLKEITDALKSGTKDQVIEISLKDKKPNNAEEILRHFPEYFKMKIKIRIILLKLDNGETEILLTSMLDKKLFKHKVFKKLYFLRWGVEENIKFMKIRAEIENISGKRVITVKQDFFSTMLCINVLALLSEEAKKEFSKNKKISKRKYEYEINYNIALGKIKNTFVHALMDSYIDMNEYSERMIKLMIMNLEPVRPNRKYERRCKQPRRKFYMNQRRAA